MKHHRILGAISVAFALSVALSGCEKGAKSDSTPDDGATSNAAAPGAEHNGKSAQPAANSTPADHSTDTESQVSLVPLNDRTPDEAFETYIERLRVGDFWGALEVCDPDAEGTLALTGFADNLDNVRRDLEADPNSPISYDTMIQLTTSDFKALEWAVISEGADSAIVEITKPDSETTTDVNLTLLDGAWRVVPPAKTGIP